MGWSFFYRDDEEQRLSVHLSNASAAPLEIVVEPWGMVFMLPSRSSCEVVSAGGEPPAIIDVVPDDDGITFWIETAGAAYEYWQDGKLIY